MKSIALLLLTGFALMFSSCEPDIVPTASFEDDFATDYSHLQSNKDNLPRYATFEPIKFIDKSINGVKYSWEFGDGRSSTELEPVIAYGKGGEYTVTLTVQSESGTTSVVSRQIKVYDRVVKKISLLFQGWGHNLHSLAEWNWPRDKVADIVVEIGVMGPDDEYIPGTILFRSEPVRNVSVGAPVISIFPDKALHINYNLLPTLEGRKPAYVILLYALDENGEHLFYSSDYYPGLNAYVDSNTGKYRLISGATIDIDTAFE
jgi:hypothetical protein